MRQRLKVSLSLLISLLLCGGFAVFSFTPLFDFVETTFFQPRIVAERERLYTELAKCDFLHPYPTRSNFILCRVLSSSKCRVLGRDARELKLSLEKEGILVRYFDKPGLRDCIRISVGRPEQTEVLLQALHRLEPRITRKATKGAK